MLKIQPLIMAKSYPRYPDLIKLAFTFSDNASGQCKFQLVFLKDVFKKYKHNFNELKLNTL